MARDLGIASGDVSWTITSYFALVHAASAELRSGCAPANEAEAAVIGSVLGAICEPRVLVQE